MLCPITAPVTRCHEVMTEECWPRLFSWQCPVCPVPGSGHEVSVCNFSRHPMSCSGLQSPRWSLTSVSANQMPVSAVLTNERPRLAVELTWHLAHFCANYRPLPGWCLGTLDWPSWPRVQGVKKLVILKEVVCDGSKMKLNDMVSEIGQSSLFSSPVRVSTSFDPLSHNTRHTKSLTRTLDPINTEQNFWQRKCSLSSSVSQSW